MHQLLAEVILLEAKAMSLLRTHNQVFHSPLKIQKLEKILPVKIPLTFTDNDVTLEVNSVTVRKLKHGEKSCFSCSCWTIITVRDEAF